MTGIFQTKHEIEVRRVLSWLQAKNIAAEFSYKEGWYSVILPEVSDPSVAHELNQLAHTIAHSDIQPPHLGCFRQCEEPLMNYFALVIELFTCTGIVGDVVAVEAPSGDRAVAKIEEALRVPANHIYLISEEEAEDWKRIGIRIKEI